MKNKLGRHLPILRYVVQVISNYRPDYRVCSGLITIVNKPFGVGYQSNSSQRWAVSLRSTPSPSKRSFINVEFWFSEAEAI